MPVRWGTLSLPLVVALLPLAGGCSPSQEKSASGFLALEVSASGRPVAGMRSVVLTVAGVEARRADGSWVVVDSGRPGALALKLAEGGRPAALPPDLLPEGQYTALTIRIDEVEATLGSGGVLKIAPDGAGWVAQVPIDFAVVAGHETLVGLSVSLDGSFRSAHGELEFEPDVEVRSVRRVR